MIHKMSEAIATWLEKEGVVLKGEQSLFAYAVYSFLFGLLPVGIVMILGASFGMFGESVFLILPFMLIRKFSGGYHLESPEWCFVFSALLLTLALGLAKVLDGTKQIEFLTLLVFLAVASLCIFSPIDNDAKPLNGKERYLFRKIARILAITSLVVYLVLGMALSSRFTTAFGVGVLLVAVLQLPCVLKKVRKSGGLV